MNLNHDNRIFSQTNPTVIRESGIETLRLLAVFAILAFHSNFYALGGPSRADFCTAPVLSILRTLAEFATLVCVDVFVLVSGWFGIRPNAKRMLGLWFQCAFFCVLLYVVGRTAGVPVGSKVDALRNLFWVGKWNWFIKSYVGLYLLSPVLNAFADSAPRRTFATAVAAFYAFQTAFWLFPMSHHDFIQDGLSTFSFVGLYLLARFTRIHSPRFATQPRWTDASAFFAFVFFGTTLYVLGRFVRIPRSASLAYSSPLAIASSLTVLLFFSKCRFQSKTVNTIARSSYAPYLFQTHPSIAAPLFYPAVAFAAGKPLSNYWLSMEGQTWLIPPDAGGWQMSTAVHFASVLLVLACTFTVSILLDQIRIVLWNAICRRFSRANAERLAPKL